MNLQKSWNLRVDPSVLKALKKIPRPTSEVILNVIRLLPFNPYFGDIQKMKDEHNNWRRRIGSYRILYKIDVSETMILVFHVERRTSKTY